MPVAVSLKLIIINEKQLSAAHGEEDTGIRSQTSAAVRPPKRLRLILQPGFPPGPKLQQRMLTTHSKQKANEAAASSSPSSDAHRSPQVPAPGEITESAGASGARRRSAGRSGEQNVK